MMLILTFMVLAHTAAIGYCDEPKLSDLNTHFQNAAEKFSELVSEANQQSQIHSSTIQALTKLSAVFANEQLSPEHLDGINSLFDSLARSRRSDEAPLEPKCQEFDESCVHDELERFRRELEQEPKAQESPSTDVGDHKEKAKDDKTNIAGDGHTDTASVEVAPDHDDVDRYVKHFQQQSDDLTALNELYVDDIEMEDDNYQFHPDVVEDGEDEIVNKPNNGENSADQPGRKPALKSVIENRPQRRQPGSGAYKNAKDKRKDKDLFRVHGNLDGHKQRRQKDRRLAARRARINQRDQERAASRLHHNQDEASNKKSGGSLFSGINSRSRHRSPVDDDKAAEKLVDGHLKGFDLVNVGKTSDDTVGKLRVKRSFDEFVQTLGGGLFGSKLSRRGSEQIHGNIRDNIEGDIGESFTYDQMESKRAAYEQDKYGFRLPSQSEVSKLSSQSRIKGTNQQRTQRQHQAQQQNSRLMKRLSQASSSNLNQVSKLAGIPTDGSQGCPIVAMLKSKSQVQRLERRRASKLASVLTKDGCPIVAALHFNHQAQRLNEKQASKLSGMPVDGSEGCPIAALLKSKNQIRQLDARRASKLSGIPSNDPDRCPIHALNFISKSS